MFFLGGVLAGIFVFGETVPWFWTFYQEAGKLGELTLPQWLQVDPGVVALGIVVLALGMFAAAERIEAWAGARRAASMDRRAGQVQP